MEVDEKPTEKYTDIGGLDKQIEEIVEAIVWPMKEAERFKKIGIKAPKGECFLLLILVAYPEVLIFGSYLRCPDVRTSWNR
jgi:26S proteasome regulatory subunit T5